MGNKLIAVNFSHRIDMENCISCQHKFAKYKNAHLVDHGYLGHGGMIDNGYNVKFEQYSDINTMLNAVETVNDEWSLILRNCTYIRRNNASNNTNSAVL